jgi:hypothetical protein
MSGINPDRVNAPPLRSVLDKRRQLRNPPAMQPSFVVEVLALLASSQLRRFSEGGQLLQHDGPAGRGLLDDALSDGAGR